MKNSISSFLLFVLLFVSCFIFSSNFSYAQENNLPKTKFMVGYFGETITHIGLNLGIEYYPFQTEKYQIILTSSIGGYTHIRNNTSLFIRQQWGQRITFSSGIFIDQFIGLGYLHNFTHGGQNYEVLPNGAVVETPNSGRSMIMPSVSLGTGYDFSKKTNKNIVYFLRPELFWKAPFNGYYLTHFALNTGIIFNLHQKHEN